MLVERVLGRLVEGDLPHHQVAPLSLGQQAGAGPLLHHLGWAVGLGVSWGISELERFRVTRRERGGGRKSSAGMTMQHQYKHWSSRTEGNVML